VNELELSGRAAFVIGLRARNGLAGTGSGEGDGDGDPSEGGGEGEGDGNARLIGRLAISSLGLTCRAGSGAGVRTRGTRAGSVGSQSCLSRKKWGQSNSRSPV
jgi:hypothetical protein